MKRLLFICLCCLSLGVYATQKDYLQQINDLKAETHPLLRSLSEKGVMHAYSSWARAHIANREYMPAVEVYQLAVRDTFLSADYRTVLAMELAALYNNQLLMHRSAQEVLDENRFSAEFPQAWVWNYRMAQTQLYMHQYDQALSQLDSLLTAMPDAEYDVYATRGYLHLSQQRYPEAVADLTQAMRRSADSTDYYRMASNMAFAQAGTNDCDGAIETISGCLRYVRKTGQDIDAAIYHRKRAQLYMACGDTAAADANYKTYWQLERGYIIRHFAAMTEQQRLDYWANRKPLLSQAFQIGQYDPSFLADLAVFRHQAALLGVHDTNRAALEKRLSVNAKQIQKALSKEEAALEFVKYKDQGTWRYAALVLTPTDIRFVPLCDEEQLPVQDICSTSSEDKNRLYTSRELGELLWQPLLPYIRHAKEIWFAPAGILHMLAIEHLVYPEPQRPAMHRLTSTGLLAQRAKKAKQPGVNALLIGGLDYDRLEDEETPAAPTNQNGLRYWVNARNRMALFTYLPGSRAEVDAIADNIARWVKTYDESEEMLKQEFGLFNLVHLSTHGYSLEVAVTQPDELWSDSVTTDNSLLGTGIALSGANIAYRYPTRDDGLLTGREICEMDLRKVDFVVASACQSAQGRISDEGPAGLLRSLKLAGVGAVLATLWPVDDTATTLFMHYFYEAWQNGKQCTRQQALLRAQEQLRQYGTDTPRTQRTFNAATLHGEYTQTQTAIYDAPYYWAPFILVDDIQTNK